jgi:parallel beta-helix repeat protein
LFLFIPMLLLMNGCNGIICSVPPSITGQPANQTAEVGQPVMFTVAVAGSGTLTYQWLKDGVVIPGATQASYITPTTASNDSGSTFAIVVTNPFGTITSTPALLTVVPSSASNVFFVAPYGSDSNPGTIDQPFLTIQHCASYVAPGSTCEVRAGTYRETVTPNSGITITAYDLEPVVIDGSDPVSGWTQYQGSIYKTHVVLRTDDTNQVFVGSDMMTEARWPNGDNLFQVNWANEKAGTDAGHVVDRNLPSVDWTGAKIHLWGGSDPFGHETGVVTSSGVGQISIDIDQTGTCPTICPVSGGYYYLFGTLSALDAEREWFYDSNSETLYFMAPGKVNPDTLDVRTKQRRYAFDLRGKSGVTVRNISLFASTIVTDNTSSNNTLDRIDATYVSHFTSLPTAPSDPTGSNFTILLVHQSDSGIVINGTGNVLENSTISYSAGAGVALEGSNNTIRNNLIENIDYIGDYDSGIDLDGDGNEIEYNTIHTVGRQGIVVNAVLNQDMSNNNLYDAMKFSRDGAEIYSCCFLVASATRIHHNWIHDTTQVISGAGDDLPMAGIYIDNGSIGFAIDQNVLWNNEDIDVQINGSGAPSINNNNIHNNTIPDEASGARIEVSNVSVCTSVYVVNNRVALKVTGNNDGTACAESNNNPFAPGANEMLPSTQVGCNFDGCSSDPPRAFEAGGGITACPVTQAAQN